VLNFKLGKTGLNPRYEVFDRLQLERAGNFAVGSDRGNLTSDEREYIHLLKLLVSEYEEKHHIPDIYGVNLLKVLIETNILSKYYATQLPSSFEKFIIC
jgi:hypothetical protein